MSFSLDLECFVRPAEGRHVAFCPFSFLIAVKSLCQADIYIHLEDEIQKHRPRSAGEIYARRRGNLRKRERNSFSSLASHVSLTFVGRRITISLPKQNETRKRR